jgi:hypothetical protein
MSLRLSVVSGYCRRSKLKTVALAGDAHLRRIKRAPKMGHPVDGSDYGERQTNDKYQRSMGFPHSP